MGLFDTVDEDNFLLFAAHHYYNPICIDADDFYEDLKRFKYIKRLLNRYVETGKVSERLILNHLIVIFNVFGVEPGLLMLEHKIDWTHWSSIKSYLVFLKVIDNTKYTTTPLDPNVDEALRKI